MVKDMPHYLGHRSRLRQRMDTEPRALCDHELLELLLSYALPRRDTKPLAKNMLAACGSLSEVLNASPERLAELPGFGEATATFWRTLQECQTRKASQPLTQKEVFTSPEQVRDMICSRLGHLSKEEFWVILLDNQNRLIAFERVFRGTVDQTAAYPREILELALRRHASGLILVHNHPGASTQPSDQDKNLTQTISRLAADMGLRLLDHLIVTAQDYSSFRTLGLL